MLVLCSNGLSSEALLNAVGKRIKARGKAAVVVTADHEYKEKNYHVNRIIAELASFHLSVDLLDLDQIPAKDLLRYDVVEFIGGNPFYLLHSIREHHAVDVLKTIVDTRVLIGWSAAAFVFGPTLQLVNRFSPDMNFLGLKDLNGIGLTDIQVLPHYEACLKRFDRLEQTCQAYEREHSVKIIRLYDGDGVLIDGDAIDLCRGSTEPKRIWYPEKTSGGGTFHV